MSEDTEKVCNQEFQESMFDHFWNKLAQQGKCDAWGGTEHRRVIEEWRSAGRPWNITRFIRERTEGGLKSQ